jgi:hypothetical protein
MPSIQLLTEAASSAVPATTTVGVDLGTLRFANQLVVLVTNPSAGASDAATIRLWGRSAANGSTFVAPGAAVWYPLGSANQYITPAPTNTTKGIINNGEAITVNGAASNSAAHAEVLMSLRDFDTVYAQLVGATTGTWNVALMTRDPGNRGLGEGV